MMKKLFLMLIALIGLGYAASAQTATGSCTIPGSKDAIKVVYYNEGNIGVTVNGKEVPANIHVNVVCHVTVNETMKPRDNSSENAKGNDSKKVNKEETVTLCNLDINKSELKPNATVKFTNGVKPMKEDKTKNYKYVVTVSLPK